MSIQNALTFGTIQILPERASTFADSHDVLFWGLIALLVVSTAAVSGLILFFVVRYRETNLKVDRSKSPIENLKLELTWTIIPIILGFFIFLWGASVFLDMRRPPNNSEDVFVVGKQWMWQVQHPNGIRENNELHIPLGRPIKFTMISQDVIHSFYIPAMRAQMHVVPGRYTTLWVQATQVGKFNLFCSMHCGTQHSEMGGYVYVMAPADYEKWLANGGNSYQTVPKTMQQAGEKLFLQNVCGSCHGATDSLRGPSLYGLFGSKRIMQDGSVRIADEAYIRESILNPYNNIVQGYSNTMPVYDRFTEVDILNLIAYMKSLGSAPNQNIATPKENNISNMANQAHEDLAKYQTEKGSNLQPKPGEK